MTEISRSSWESFLTDNDKSKDVRANFFSDVGSLDKTRLRYVPNKGKLWLLSSFGFGLGCYALPSAQTLRKICIGIFIFIFIKLQFTAYVFT